MQFSAFKLLTSGRILSLPKPVLIALGALVSIGVLGGVFFSTRGSPNQRIAIMIVAGGIIVVFLLLALFRAIVKWRAKAKANPLAAGIAGNAAAAPQGVSEPARRARLDDLRRNFEQGVEKFRAAGKNLYSVPWYVLVGEPGSGKTEAIRHCNVGFPPGLQDQLQGAGGTLNMNWWFTNSAIILDTAGRLMFEEVAPGSTNEWMEFLKLLKQSRPNSPVNGLLLVIPVDTLIKDSADAIEKKATKIAQQFDQIQRTLGVRFPVFVIITKCDLLNGFREFFDDLDTPQRQHQIMGWSNPAPLDERFDPAKVIAHLETVKQRLIARRQNLLLDPVNTEDPQARRVDQVDALYALPDSVTAIGPRLRRYLEMIFVAGEWSPKPLFLRGIYFTSSMTEGAALDDELAKALGVPVDSLPGGAIFRKDRAYFLRDLFLEKVFREKGLVTRATNADKQQRTRRMLVLGFGFFSVLILFGVTFWASWDLKRTLGGESNFWRAVSEKEFGKIAIIKKSDDPATPDRYHGDEDFLVEGRATSLPRLLGENLPRVKSDLKVPFIFKPVAVFSGDINQQRHTAYREAFEITVLKPVYTKARTQIPGAGWSAANASKEQADRLSAGVAELMKLEYAKATGTLPSVEKPQVRLDPLFALALTPEDYALYISEKAKDQTKIPDNVRLQEVADWVYTAQAEGDKKWPPESLAAGSPANIDAIKLGVQATLDYWNSHAFDDSGALANITDMQKALDKFQAAETALQRLKDSPIDKMSLYVEFRNQWLQEYAKLMEARDTAVKAWTATGAKGDKDTLESLYTAKKTEAVTGAQSALDTLLKLTPADGSVDLSKAKDDSKASYAALAETRTKIVAAQEKLKDWKTASAPTLKRLKELDVLYLTMVTDTDKVAKHRFEVQAHLYQLASDKLVKDSEKASLGPIASLQGAFEKVEADGTQLVDEAKKLAVANQATAPTDPLLAAVSFTQYTVESSVKARKFLLADFALSTYPKDAAGWSAAITKMAQDKETPREGLVRPQVPLVTFPKEQDKTFNEQYSPDAVNIVLSRLKAVRDQTDKEGKILDVALLKARVEASDKSFASYKEAYVHYWRDVTKDELAFNYKEFKDLSSKLGDTTEGLIAEKLKAYSDAIDKALAAVGVTDETSKTAAAISHPNASEVLRNWANFGTDSTLVRRAILGKLAIDFKEGYTVISAKGNESCAGLYWNRLPVTALRALVADGQTQIMLGIQELAKFEKFPLAPMTTDPKNDIPPTDVAAARSALEKIRGAAAVAAVSTAPGVPTAGSVATLPISQGGLVSSKEIDDQLTLLRGINLIGDKREYFDKLDRMLAGLPPDSKPLVAILTVNKKKLTEDKANAISIDYAYMTASQGGKQLKDFSLNESSDENASVEYSGGDLTFVFRQTRDGKPAQTETIPGPWALLRLVKSSHVNTGSLTVTGNKWVVEYVITTPAPDNKKRSLWLTIEFKQPLPETKDWPVPPSRIP